MAASLGLAGALTSAVAFTSPAGASGILPPNEPPANIAPQVNVACASINDTSAACTNSVLHNIDYGRMLEGVGPMVLPNGYAQMSVPQQLLVAVNLERGARGIGQSPGLSDTLDNDAQVGANAGTDPMGPPGVGWGSNWAGDVTPLDADFNWMYNDGIGGFNSDCSFSNLSGCWGHRTNVLGGWSGPMGAGYAPMSSYNGSYTQLFQWGSSYPVVDPYSSVTFPGSVAPDVVKITPTTASAPATGTPVTIEGNYFSAFSGGQTPTVMFGSSPATNVHVNWDGELTADIPADPAGTQSDTVTVTVTSPAGTSDGTPGSAADSFAYTRPAPPVVSSLSPASGQKAGGQTVAISGANFIGTTSVTFGSTPAAGFIVNSATSITATSPSSSALGPVNVVVTTALGGASTGGNDVFTYVLEPTSTAVSVTPTSTAPGASVTYAATVTAADGTAVSGTVMFAVGSAVLCTTASLVHGAGSCSSTTAATGADTVTAWYSGDTAHAWSAGSATLVVEPQGVYTPLPSPTRICDTRPQNPSNLSSPATQCDGANNAGSTIVAGGSRIITVSGFFGIPTNASAVIMNVTAVNPTGPGYLTVYPTGGTRPVASNLNYTAGQVVPNAVEVQPGTNGDVTIYSLASTDVVVDVEGYVAPTSGTNAGGLYSPLSSPARICDTRAGNPSTLNGAAAQCNGVANAGTRVAAGGSGAVQVTGLDAIPAGATAAVLNVTAVNPSTAGYLTVFPQGGARPSASNVNFTAGVTSANRAIVPLSSTGQVEIYSSANADVVVDVSGYYTASGSGSEFSAEPAPVRICDTRAGNPSALSGSAAQCNGVNNSGEAVGSGQTSNIKVTGLAGVPANARAVVVNLTGVTPSADTFLTVFPGGSRPVVSDLNPMAGQVRANLCVATVNPDGTISVFNDTGSVSVVVDVLGWYS